MADETRTILIDVEVEDKDFDKEIGEVNAQLRQNREEIKELSKDYKNNATEIAKLEAENRTLTKSKQQLVKESNSESNSLNALRLKVANLTKERNNLDTSTKEGAKRFRELNKEILNNTNKLKEAEQAGGDFRRNVGNYSGAIESAIPGLAGLKQGLVGITTAARAFIATPLGAILAAIAIAVSAVTAAFKDSEEGQNKFAKIMAVINVVLGNFRDLLADLGEKIIAFFEDPQEGLRQFGELIKQNIITRFRGILNLIPNLGKAIDALFSGDFVEAGRIAVDALGQVAFGVDSITNSVVKATEAVAEFIEHNEDEIKIAKRVADARANADILARKLLVDRAKLESEIAGLRLKARQEDEFTAEERKQALLDAQVLQDELLAREKEVLELREFAQIEENKFSRSTKENLDAEAQAIAAVAQIEAARLNQQRQTQRELNRVNREIERDRLATEKARQKASADEIKRIQARADAVAKAAEEEARVELELLEFRKRSNQEALLSLQGSLAKSGKLTKIAALAEIAKDTARAISALTAASEANPANPITFGAAGVIQFIAGIARITANISQARKLIKGSGGGPTVDVGSVSAPTAGGGGGRSEVAPGLSTVNASLLSQFSSPAQAQAAQRDATVAAISNLPQSTVAVVDINEGINKRAVKVNEANLA